MTSLYDDVTSEKLWTQYSWVAGWTENPVRTSAGAEIFLFAALSISGMGAHPASYPSGTNWRVFPHELSRCLRKIMHHEIECLESKPHYTYMFMRVVAAYAPRCA
jgi:hypothetical protein